MAIRQEDLHGLVLLRDSLASDGGFLLAHILKLLLGLDGRHRVVLVAVRQTMVHYGTVFRKLGLNVSALAAAGRVVLLDALRPSRGHPEQLLDLRILHKAIADACAVKTTSLEPPSPVCLLFDDLTTLMCYAEHPVDIAVFLHTAVIAGPGSNSSIGGQSNTNNCCVAVVHAHDVADKDKSMLALHHYASTVVDVESLKTGRSAEVGGRVRVTRRKLPFSSNSNSDGSSDEIELGEDEMYFALGVDGGVRFHQSSVLKMK